MPQNGYSIGRDVSVVIIKADGTVLRPSEIINFQRKQKTKDETILPLSGPPDHLVHPQGWDLKFEYKRDGSACDDYFAGLETAYYAGQNTQPVTVQETITEPSGAVTQYRYDRVVLKYDDAGSAKSDESIMVSISGMASTRIKVA